MKKGILLVASLATGLVSCSKPIIHYNALYVNRQNSNRVVSHMPEEEGIQQMRALAKTTGYEEAWAYVQDNGSFHEIGYSESRKIKPGDREFSVAIDEAYIHGLARSAKKITLYHLHPYFESMKEEPGTPSSWDRILGVVPSDPDFEVMKDYTCKFMKFKPKTAIEFRVVSGEAVTTYGLTQLGRQEYCLNKKEFQPPTDTVMSFSVTPKEQYERAVREKNNEYIHVTTRVFEDND